MRITLVQPPSLRYDADELTPPLGLLMLAASLEQRSMDVALVDLNLRGLQDPHWAGQDFYQAALPAISQTAPDLVGFTSMALESHLCLELARRLKQLDPGLIVVLGGPHFSAIAEPVLTLYAWVDFVVTGEAEGAFAELCVALRDHKPLRLANLARRTAAGIGVERVLKPQPSLDALALPAYHLLDLQEYFALNPLRMVSFEHARGCALRCGFCYSPVHWGQGEQRLAVERVQRELSDLYELGARHFFFVSDNFVNSKALAQKLCGAITELGLDLNWNCYATLAQLNDEVLDAMALAGCRAAFIGVDAVTETSKRRFKKRYFKHWRQLSGRLEACLGRAIVPTCAFMVEPPSPAPTLTDQTLQIAAYTQSLGCAIRLNPLTVYSRTEVDTEQSGGDCFYSTAKPELLFDTHEIVRENSFARRHPALFPCHNARFSAQDDWSFCSGLYTAFTVLRAYPRALTRFSLDLDGSLWRLCDAVSRRAGELRDVPADRRRGYLREVFGDYVDRQPGLAPMRSVMAWEAAESALIEDPAPDTLTLAANPSRPAVTVRAYRTARLDIGPADVLSYQPVARQSAERRYVMVRLAERLAYFELPPSLADKLPDFSELGADYDFDDELLALLEQLGIVNPQKTPLEINI